MKKSELLWAICEIDDDLIHMAKEDHKMKSYRKRWIRTSLCAAVIVLMFMITGFAAYEYNWFGFRNIFGVESNLIEDHVQVLNPEAENVNTDIVAEEHVYTDAEQYVVDEGIGTLPEQAELTGTGVQAITENYLYTLEELVVSRDTLMAVLKVEAQNEAAIPRMSLEMGKGVDVYFSVCALNQTGEGNHERERKNGGLSCEVMQLRDGVGYYLISNAGGEFEAGDRILFKDLWDSVNLFEITLTEVMDADISMDVDGKYIDSISLTAFSLSLNGFTGRVEVREASLTLRDGNVIELPSLENDFAYAEYGTYGALSYSGTIDPETGYGILTWRFSRLIDPGMVLKVTINGTDYNLD